LLAFPLFSAPVMTGTSNEGNEIGDSILFLGKFFPAVAQRWFRGWAQQSSETLLWLSVLLGSMVISSRLARAISGRMDGAWRLIRLKEKIPAALPTTRLTQVRESIAYKTVMAGIRRWILPTAAAAALGAIGLFLVSRAGFEIMDRAGYVCTDSYEE